MLCTGCSESLPPPNNSPLTDAEKQARLFAVARAGDYIVAVSSNGFYRTQVSTKNWERISVPRGMSVQGQFAVSEANSNVVYFWPSAAFETKGSLFVSSNAGSKWTLVSDDYGFSSVFQNRDGRLYATIWKKVGGSTQGVHSRLIMSENGGKYWKDISQNIFGDLYGIFADPKFTNRICVVGNSIRNYIFESTNDTYSSWTATREWEWRKDSKTDDDFLRGGYSTTTVLYMLNANLQNYFDYNFGNTPQIQAFVIDVDTNHLEFAVGQKIQVPITVKFLPDYGPVKFVDATNNEEFWRISCITPDGKRVGAAGRRNRVEQADDSEKLKQRTGDNTGFQIVELSSTNSYSRTLSFDHLTDFSKSGTYRIRLSYDSIGWGWENKKHSGIWSGYFSSPVFTLTIKP